MHDESPLVGLNRDELFAMTALSLEEGQIAAREATVMQNLLSLQQLKVRQAMTHRTVVFSLPDITTVEQFLQKHAEVSFSRIPIYEDGEPEKITGYVLKSDILLAFARGNIK